MDDENVSKTNESELSNDVNQATSSAEKAASAESAVDQARKNYSQNVTSFFNNFKQLKSKVSEADKNLEESRVENAAKDTVSKGGVVSISESLEMIEQEKAASKAAWEARVAAVKTSLTGAKNVMKSGFMVLGTTGVAAGKDAIDGITNLGGVAALAAGAAVGVAGGNSSLSEIATTVTDNVLGISSSDPEEDAGINNAVGFSRLEQDAVLGNGVEVKYVDGVMTLQDAYESVYDTGNEAYDAGVGQNTMESKEPINDGYVGTLSTGDAMTTSGAEFDEMSDLTSTRTAKTASFTRSGPDVPSADDALNINLDELSNNLERRVEKEGLLGTAGKFVSDVAKGVSGGGTLQSAIVQGVVNLATDTAKDQVTGTSVAKTAMDKLKEKGDEIDANEAAKSQQTYEASFGR